MTVSLLMGVVLLQLPGALGRVSGAEVLRKVEAVFSGVSDYTVTLDITADVERLSVPPMHVTMYFKQPDKVHFDAEGFALLPREGMAWNPGRLLERYSVEGLVEDTVDGRTDYRLSLKTKDERNRFRTALLYVDPDRWVADRIVFSSTEGRMMTVNIVSELISGYWLPLVMRFEFASQPAETADMPWQQQAPEGGRKQAPRKGVVTILYSGYRVNTGLDDGLFQAKPASTHQE
jgi:outer membrane lipoprotein-sorting protein